MQERRDTNSLLPGSGRILLSETIFLAAVVRQCEPSVEKLLKIDCLIYCLTGRGRLSHLQEIPFSNFHGGQAYSRGDAIHMPFHRKQALRCTETTKRSVRRSVCCDRLRANPDIRPVIRSARVNCAAREYHWRQGRISATIHRKFDFAGQNFAVPAHRGPVPCPRRMPFCCGGHVLHSVVKDI